MATAALRAYFAGIDITGKLEDSFDQNVVCIKRRTARSKPFGARGRSAARAVSGSPVPKSVQKFYATM